MLEKLPDAIGHALRNRRAGLENLAFNLINPHIATTAISLSSPAFNDYDPLPVRFTADGDGISPPLAWVGIPAGAASLALIVEDADSPTPHTLVHAIAVGLPAADGALTEGALSQGAESGIKVGRNSYLQAKWLPPDPPSAHGMHRYVFQMFALNQGVAFPDHPGREAVLKAIDEHAIAAGMLVGTYERPDNNAKPS